MYHINSAYWYHIKSAGWYHIKGVCSRSTLRLHFAAHAAAAAAAAAAAVVVALAAPVPDVRAGQRAAAHHGNGHTRQRKQTHRPYVYSRWGVDMSHWQIFADNCYVTILAH